MAVNYLFDTKYFARRGDAATATAQNRYRLVIGDHTGTVSATSSEMVLFDPGIKINWDGDQGRFSNAIMGSSLEFTARLDDAQLATWNSLLDLNEGNVFCLFFDSHNANAKPWWWGHLMIESTSIRVENEHHTIDLTFSDGLAALRGAKWENTPGVFYTGFKKLSFYMREIQSKIPAFPGYKDYIDNVLSETYRPVFTHIGFPFPATESGGTEYRYDELDALFDNIRVRAETFNKPKKQVDRTRELEAAPDFFNAAEVLEDICKTFGATACVFNGFINLGGRLDSALLKGINVHQLRYSYDASGSDAWQIVSDYNSDTKLLNSHNFYEVKAGATMGRTLPIAQANLTHEEGGSDYLAADGYFLDTNISHLDYSNALQLQQLHDASSGGIGAFPPDGLRQDLWYDFDYDNRGGDSITLPYYTYPANRTGYLGFPARTLDELEVPSGEVMQLTFGGQVMLPSRSKLGSFINNMSHIGSVVVVRMRIQFKATNGVYYRLSRTVHTHALTGGNPDFINIEMNLWPFTSVGDKKFFRKLYNDVAWVPSTSSTAYADSWFEIIVPHGDSENSGEGYGATLHTLTQKYDGQVSYAPIGTKVKGDNDGAGVILQFSGEGEGTYNQYFRVDESFELPYGAGDATLSFDEFYFEMGMAQWDSDRGPRGNGAATGTWLGETPTWHSAYADGTGGSQISSDKEKGPSYIHFTGLRVAIGDGSESSDFTTKMTGGDGYEIHNMGSSRLGSRKAFVQPHLNGTLWVKRKTADANGSFASPVVYDEKVRWFGHRGHDVAQMPNTLYDSLHGYVAEAFLQLFGESRVKYNMTLIPKQTGSGSGFGALINPFVVMETNGLIDRKDIDEYLMPLSYSWVMNEGVSGEFLKVGQARDISSIGPVFVPRPAKGPGGIVGLGTGLDLTKPVFESKFVTDAVTVDDETGDVTAIAVKAGSTAFTADKVAQGSTNKFVTAAQLTALAGFTNDEAVYVKWDSANNFFEDGNDAFVSHRFTSAERTKVGHIAVSAAIDLDVTKGQAFRYGFLDDTAASLLTQGNLPNWINTLGQMTRVERFFVTTLLGTGNAETELTTSVASGFQRERTIWYSYRATTEISNNNKSWAKLSTLWSGATLSAGDSFATANSKIQEFLASEVTNTQIRFSFAITVHDVTSFTGLLDTYANAQAAYSLRRLSSNYTGSAIQVRRSSNNDVLDIGFTSTGALDTAALLTFCGNGDGFVKIWYDQSGSNRYVQQSSTGAQPKIVSSGSVILENSKPAVLFDGSNDYLKTPISFAPNPNGAYNLAVVSSYDRVNAPGQYGGNSWSSSQTSQNFQTIMLGSAKMRFAARYSAQQQLPRPDSTATFAIDTQIISTATFGQNLCEAFYNGTQEADKFGQSLNSLPRNDSQPMAIGGRSSDGANVLEGRVQEFIVWSNSTAHDSDDISAAINTFYGAF